MKRISGVVSALVACVFSIVAYSPIAKIQAAEKTPAAASSSVANSALDLQHASTLALRYSGDASAVSALRAGATATALTSADFDGDGAPDIVAGYRTPNGGVVTLTRGNPDAFAPKDTRWYARAAQGKIPPAFLTAAKAYTVPESPDILAAADFTRSGHIDILVAKRGGGLYLLSGDGQGNFSAAQRIDLAGDVTALTVNGAGHVAVGIQSGSNTQVLIFNPRSSGGLLQPVATHPLSAPATSMAWGALGIHSSDLAVAAGSNVHVFYNALSTSARHETIEVGAAVQALSIGDFIWDRENRQEIAALTEDGSIHILQHGVLDTRALTTADAKGRRAEALARSKRQNDALSIGAWKDSKQVAGVASAQATLQASRLANGLMVLDAGRKQVHLVNAASGAQSAILAGAPVAARELPVMLNGSHAVVMLTSSQVAPSVAISSPGVTYSVTNTSDSDPISACTTTTSGVLTGLTLRSAVCEANNLGAATSTINVAAGTYNLSLGELQAGNASVTGGNISIVGLGAGPANVVIHQTDNNNRIIEADSNVIGSTAVSVSNVTLSGGHPTNASGTDGTFGGGAILAGGPSDTLTITNAVLTSNTTDTTDEGGAVNFGSDGTLSITNSTFSSNTATNAAGGAVVFNGNPGTAHFTITNSAFTGNTSSGGATARGGALALFPSTGNTDVVTGSTFTGNSASGSGGLGGAIYSINTGVTVSNSRIVGNTATTGTGFYEDFGAGDVSTIINNWWGCNAGPGNPGCDSVGVLSGGSATFNPWLVLSLSSSASVVAPNGTATLTADLTHNSSAASGFSVPTGTPATFAASAGSVSPTTTTLTAGVQTSTFTAPATAGNPSVSVTVDNQTVSKTINVTQPVTVNTSPTGLSITVDGTTATAPQSFNWVVGSSHTIATTTPQTSGTVQYNFNSWSDAGAISHSVTASAAVSSYTATFSQAITFTSATTTTFKEGETGSFQVTATGAPTITFSETGALPGGVTLSASGLLSGYPAAGSAGSYPITITAHNGIAPDATQPFTLVVSSNANATMISPIPGTTLGSSATFTWSTGTGVSYYLLYVGTMPRTHDIFDSGLTHATSAVVTPIPTSGANLYVTLYSYFGGVPQTEEYIYTQSGTLAVATISSPAPGSQLTSSSQTFTWNAGSGATEYILFVGTAANQHDLFYLDTPVGTTSANVTGIPTNGAAIFVSLFTKINQVWQPAQIYTYRESGVPATMISPAPGSTLPGSSVTFNWSAGAGVQRYLLYVGTAARTHDVFYLSAGPGTTSALVNNIPTGGATLYVTLFSLVNGAWQSEADTYTEAGSPVPAVITSPAPGSTLSGSSATFTWTPGAGPSQYLLYVGTAPNTHDVSVQTLPYGTTSTGVTGIPTTGAPLYVTLYSLINGTWSAGQAATYTTGP